MDKKIQELKEKLNRAEAEQVFFDMTYGEMFVVLVGNIQLALRHQENTGPSSVVVKTLAREMAERIITDLAVITPEVLAATKWVEELGVDPGQVKGG